MKRTSQIAHILVPAAMLWCAGQMQPVHAAPVALADEPLFVSTSIDPNVMLLIDTSGSMNHIIWADGYDNTVSYPHWGTYDPWGTNSLWDPNDGNILLRELAYCRSYGRAWKAGYRNGTLKCLKLPDPVGRQNTRYTGNYLNYLFETYANGTDLTQGQIPNDYRMNVARTVATDLVTNTGGMRFCLSSFNRFEGGTIDAECGSGTSTLTSAISSFTASTWTPLAETYYEVTRYFRGLSSYYNSNTNYTSPIQYRCQKNFTIVITDGLPTYDTNFPSDDPDDPAGSPDLPDWDGLAPATTSSMYPNFPQYSDGFQGEPGTTKAWEGYTLYLDDLAKFAYDIDMRKSGTDLAGKSFDDPKFPKQNMETYTIGFSTSNQMLKDAAEYGNGAYYTADAAATLTDALRSAISDIQGKTASAASIALDAGFITSGSHLYQARFNSKKWTGQLLAFALNTDGTLDTSGTGPEGSAWDAGAKLNGQNYNTGRRIITYKPSNRRGIPFRWPNDPANPTIDELDTPQTDALDIDPDSGSDDNKGEARLNFLRGDTSNEQSSGGSFRNRSGKLGDIVHSAPAYVAAPPFRYPDTWPAGAPENNAAYSAFRNTHKNRAPMVYVGANDGMLHGFDAETGFEKIAYVPGKVYSNLNRLTSPNYTHRYYVDGSPTTGDVFYNNAWHTVLVGGLNKGGQGIYALDITDPGSFSESNAASLVLWEFTDEDDADLGYTYSRPAIVRMHNGKWAAVFGNGYNNTESDGYASTTGHAVLFIVDIENGSLIKKIDTKTGSTTTPNGLSTPAPVDVDGDFIIDYIYAGDLQGNVWKFDVTGSNPNQWDVAFKQGNTPKPLFTAVYNGTPQPITSRPEVGRHKKGLMVYFGTGKYLGSSDVTDTSVQTFYGILDEGATVSGRNDLLEQEILVEDSYTFNTDNGQVSYDLRVTSDNQLTGEKGWYIDLLTPGQTATGERQVSDPLLRSGRIIFTTLIPESDPCAYGGTGWIMELDPKDGSRLDFSPFDLNKNGLFTTADYVTVTSGGAQSSVPASGKKSHVGIIPTPGVGVTQQGTEVKYTPGSSGQIEVTPNNPGPGSRGRQSWRQLR